MHVMHPILLPGKLRKPYLICLILPAMPGIKMPLSLQQKFTLLLFTPIQSPTQKVKNVNGTDRKDWEIAQAGLSFEHGGIFGSANRHGPIMLASHAGLFIRMYQLT